MSEPGNADHSPPVESTATFRHLVEAPSTHAIFSLDAGGEVAVWPASATRLYGYDADEVLGESLAVLFETDDGREGSVEDHLAAARHSGAAELEGWHERADGTTFWATLALTPVDDDELERYVAVASDRTDHRRQVRTLERQNDRLKEFTDILSHDLRSPLTLVDGRLDLYRETNDETHLEVMDDTIGRMERLVDDLLRVARQGDVVTDPRETDVGEVARLAWEGTDSEAASIEYEDVGRAYADPDRLSELFENLFRNAVEHGGRDVTVRVGPLDDGFFVEDDGRGISPEIREEVFDHGFTTDDDGTGYGLSVVRTIVGAHGWDVSLTEGAEGGARFEITNVDFAD